MRRGIWILATLATLGLAYSVGTAQDNGSLFRPLSSDYFGGGESPTAQPSGNQYFSRTGTTSGAVPRPAAPAASSAPRMPAEESPARFVRTQDTASPAPSSTSPNESAPAVRNYYRELFGDRPVPEGVKSVTAPGSGRLDFTSGDVQQTSHEQPQTLPAEHPARQLQPTGVIPAAGIDVDRNAGMMNAEFRRPIEPRTSEDIQQVRASEENRSPFAPAGQAVMPPQGPSADSVPADSAMEQNPFAPPAATPQVAPPAVAENPFENKPLENKPVEGKQRTNVVPRGGVAQIAASDSDAQSPTVTLQWVKRSDINLGQECDCELVVRNGGKLAVREVAVDAYFPATVRLVSAVPRPAESKDHLSWTFPQLEAGEERVISIKLIPSERGELATSALVRFTGMASGVFRVDEPLLKLEIKGPEQVMVGDPASQLIYVSNPGTGIAKNVQIETIVPQGLEHPRGERLLMEIGSLNPGESRMVRLALAAIQGGQHEVKVVATADAGLRQTLNSQVNVIAPSLKVALEGPALRYIGRSARYLLKVTNDGAAASNNVRAMHKIPEGFTFEKADGGGKYDSSRRIVSWFVGRLEPGQSVVLNVDVNASQLGRHTHLAGASSEHGSVAETQLTAEIEGSASLAMEIVDLDDPVEVGAETAYEVRIVNEGTQDATNVSVSCELPNGVQLLNARGPVEHIADNGLVVFKSLAALPPGKTAIYRVHVKGVIEGNHRVRVRLASDSIREPLIAEELTKFYGE